jgi:hypothetical protein
MIEVEDLVREASLDRDRFSRCLFGIAGLQRRRRRAEWRWRRCDAHASADVDHIIESHEHADRIRIAEFTAQHDADTERNRDSASTGDDYRVSARLADRLSIPNRERPRRKSLVHIIRRQGWKADDFRSRDGVCDYAG